MHTQTYGWVTKVCVFICLKCSTLVLVYDRWLHTLIDCDMLVRSGRIATAGKYGLHLTFVLCWKAGNLAFCVHVTEEPSNTRLQTVLCWTWSLNIPHSVSLRIVIVRSASNVWCHVFPFSSHLKFTENSIIMHVSYLFSLSFLQRLEMIVLCVLILHVKSCFFWITWIILHLSICWFIYILS